MGILLVFLFLIGAHGSRLSTAVWRISDRQFLSRWHDPDLGFPSHGFTFEFNPRITYLPSAHLHLCLYVDKLNSRSESKEEKQKTILFLLSRPFTWWKKATRFERLTIPPMDYFANDLFFPPRFLYYYYYLKKIHGRRSAAMVCKTVLHFFIVSTSFLN